MVLCPVGTSTSAIVLGISGSGLSFRWRSFWERARLAFSPCLVKKPAHEPSSWYNRDDGATQRELVFIPEGKHSLSKQIEVGSAVCVLWRTKHPTDLTIASGLGGVRKLHSLSAEEVANGGTYVRGPFLRLEFGSKRDELAYVEVKAGPLLSPLCEVELEFPRFRGRLWASSF